MWTDETFFIVLGSVHLEIVLKRIHFSECSPHLRVVSKALTSASGKTQWLPSRAGQWAAGSCFLPLATARFQKCEEAPLFCVPGRRDFNNVSPVECCECLPGRNKWITYPISLPPSPAFFCLFSLSSTFSSLPPLSFLFFSVPVPPASFLSGAWNGWAGPYCSQQTLALITDP